MKKGFTIAVGLLAVCAASVAQAKPVTVTMATWDMNGIHKTLVNAFNATHDNVKVKLVPTNDEQKDLVSCAAGKPYADVQQYVGANGFTWMKNSLWEPLDPYLRTSPANGYEYMTNLNELKYNGKLYMMPIYTHTLVNFYNLDMIRNVGMQAPMDKTTWTEFREYAKSMTAKLKKPAYWTWPSWVNEIGYQLGGIETSGDFTPFAKGWRILADMRNVDRNLNPDLYLYQAFFEGKLALHTTAMYGIGNMRTLPANKRFNWDIGPMPTPEGAPYDVQGNSSSGMVMLRTCKVKKAAWGFIEWMAGPEAARIRMREQGELPAIRLANMAEDFTQKGRLEPKNVGFLFKQRYRTVTYHPAVSAMYPIIQKYARQAIENTISVEQARVSVEKEVQPIMAKYGLKRK